MIQLTDNVWIGNSVSIKDTGDVGAMLNVACDLRPGEELDTYKDKWPAIEYTHVGLVDGPGNGASDYCAAVLTLLSLLHRHDSVLVYDHTGARALAVSMMYLCLKNGRRPAGGSSADANNPHCWQPWDELHTEIGMKASKKLPKVHQAHIDAYDRLPYGILEAITRCQLPQAKEQP